MTFLELQPLRHFLKFFHVIYLVSKCTGSTNITRDARRVLVVQIIWLELAHETVFAISVIISPHTLGALIALDIIRGGEGLDGALVMGRVALRRPISVVVSPSVSKVTHAIHTLRVIHFDVTNVTRTSLLAGFGSH